MTAAEIDDTRKFVVVTAATVTIQPHDFAASVTMPTWCEDCSLTEPAICHQAEVLVFETTQEGRVNNTDGAVQPRNGDDTVVTLSEYSYRPHSMLASEKGHCLACGGAVDHPLHQKAADDLQINQGGTDKHAYQQAPEASIVGWLEMCGICGRAQGDVVHQGAPDPAPLDQDTRSQVARVLVLQNQVVFDMADMYGLDGTEHAAASSIGAEDRRKMAKSGVAMPDGSFPIPDVPHLQSAIRLARTPAQRQHVMKRARALGKAEMIPDNWSAGGSRQAAFLTEVNHKTLLTGPAKVMAELAAAPVANDHMLGLIGKFVGAEKANRNGALWTTADLEMGAPSVVSGPLNWLHEARHVIGSITEAQLLRPGPELAAEQGDEPFIAARSMIWKWLWPDESAVVQMASDSSNLWYSMECVSENVVCAGDDGCGKSLPYGQYIEASGLCEHMTQHSAKRRFENPTFLGGAVIVPPVRPGWADAYASTLPQAASLAEKAYEQAGSPDIAASDWEMLLAQVVSFAQA